MTQTQEGVRVSRSRRIPLAGGPGIVGHCRDLTRQLLDDWYGEPGPAGQVARDDILLLVSEVVANACRHGGTPSELRFDRGLGRLWVQVLDSSPDRPRPHGPHRAARPSAHGLYLLQQLSTGWGWIPHSTGKAVWFGVTVPG